MSPRPYRLGQRQAAIDETRARVTAAARDLLVSADPGRFSVDAVAQQAGVSRATVYYQFHSKAGLLAALFDALGASGGMAALTDAFQQPDPWEALDDFVAVFGRFWSTDRVLHRRLRALAALDPDLDASLRDRQEWRRHGAATLVTRLTSEPSAPAGQASAPIGQAGTPTDQAGASADQAGGTAHQADATGLLFILTSFESFDTLAGPDRTPESVIPLLQRLARAALTHPA